jgi:hypothetical protein
MTKAKLADRVAALEREVARLAMKLEHADKKDDPWKTDVFGAFAGDPDFLEAMRLGREWRESFRPKPRKRRARRRKGSEKGS